MHITKASIVDFLPRFKNDDYRIGVVETMGALYPKTHNCLGCSKVKSTLCRGGGPMASSRNAGL